MREKSDERVHAVRSAAPSGIRQSCILAPSISQAGKCGLSATGSSQGACQGEPRTQPAGWLGNLAVTRPFNLHGVRFLARELQALRRCSGLRRGPVELIRSPQSATRRIRAAGAALLDERPLSAVRPKHLTVNSATATLFVKGSWLNMDSDKFTTLRKGLLEYLILGIVSSGRL